MNWRLTLHDVDEIFAELRLEQQETGDGEDGTDDARRQRGAEQAAATLRAVQDRDARTRTTD